MTFDRDFPAVIRACAAAPGEDRPPGSPLSSSRLTRRSITGPRPQHRGVAGRATCRRALRRGDRRILRGRIHVPPGNRRVQGGRRPHRRTPARAWISPLRHPDGDSVTRAWVPRRFPDGVSPTTRPGTRRTEVLVIPPHRAPVSLPSRREAPCSSEETPCFAHDSSTVAIFRRGRA